MTYKTNSKEKKETVTSTRKYLGKYAKNIFYLWLQALHGKNQKQRPKGKIKTVMYTTTAIDLYPRNR